ncbi:antichymotrypsin-2-like isoform X3 [Battus philenor]|uniref:antichymotrypsin-2-like isoform X3 n=1 Tax=Battus philenor TaxID=42288 RepID=UPI0035CF0D7E
MWKTLILLLSATGYLAGILCSDIEIVELYQDSSSSFYYSQCDTLTDDTASNCNGDHEYYEDCNSTDVEDNLCVTGCRCENNYARDEEGNCCPIEQTTDTTTTTETTTVSSPPNVDSDEALKNIWEGNANFSLNFMKFKIAEKPGESFIASPFSVLIPLGELGLYAIDDTFYQLANVINVYDKDEIRQGFRRLLDDLKSPKNVTLSLAQKVFGNIQFKFNKNFEYDTKVYFDAKAENLDFSQSTKAAKTINDWVKEQTRGLIPDLVDPSTLDALTRLVLVNAIYYKGDWLRPFDPKNTQKKDFYITKDKKGTVNMMYQKGTFKYGENPALQIKALQLFYKDSDYSLLCLLPTSSESYSLEGVAQKILDPKSLQTIIDGLSYEEVKVYLPSIEISTSTDLIKVLKSVNITDAFNPQRSKFSGILENEQPLSISAAIQKAVIIINELGSQAAAANAVAVDTFSAPINGPKVFEANRPYIYFILYKRYIIFCGTYVNK